MSTMRRPRERPTWPATNRIKAGGRSVVALRWLSVVVAALAVVVAPAGIVTAEIVTGEIVAGEIMPAGVAAQTGLESTTPEDGEVVSKSVAEVVLTFNGPVELERIELFDGSGRDVVPSEIDTGDQSAVVLVFSPPLDVGIFGVRWSVIDADGAELSGSFVFEIVEPVITQPTTPDTSVTTSTTSPDNTIPVLKPVTIAPASTTVVETTTVSTVPSSTTEPVPTTVPATTSPRFAERLRGETVGDGLLTYLAHLIRFSGSIGAVGMLIALLWALQGTKGDLSLVLGWVRMFGLMIAVGAGLEWAAYQELTGASFGQVLGAQPGWSDLIAIAGGLAMTFGLTEQRSLEPVGGGFRWRPSRSSAAGLIGAALVLASYGLGGRRSSRGPVAVLRVLDVVHVGVAATWAGGILALVLIAWRRRGRKKTPDFVNSMVRFSSAAFWSLAALLASGIAMITMIVTDPAQPLESDWGRTMLVKTIVVGAAVVVAGFNRFTLLPIAKTAPKNAGVIRRIRLTLTVELTFLMVVIIVTALLVGANSR